MTADKYQPRYAMPSIEDAIKQVAPHITRVHEACAAVPPIGRLDFDQLADSVKAHGLLRPIEINDDDEIVDGRSRIQAIAAAGFKLTPKDFVVTKTDPFAIARSNNARRHLTEDQKVMAAERLLQKEEELSAQRKAEGAKKCRESKKLSLGTESVPSESEPKKRQPRAKDKVAAATGVSRDKLTAAAKLRKAAPEIAVKVEQGEMSLEEAEDKVGLVRKKQVKSSVPKPAKPEPIRKSAKGKPTGNQSLWKDDFTEITDTPDGLTPTRNNAMQSRLLRLPVPLDHSHSTQPMRSPLQNGSTCVNYSVTCTKAI